MSLTIGCEWLGHCVGAVCTTFDDCDADYYCINGRCGGEKCEWAGHCAGALCQTFNDCSNDLVCTAGVCGYTQTELDSECSCYIESPSRRNITKMWRLDTPTAWFIPYDLVTNRMRRSLCNDAIRIAITDDYSNSDCCHQWAAALERRWAFCRNRCGNWDWNHSRSHSLRHRPLALPPP